MQNKLLILLYVILSTISANGQSSDTLRDIEDIYLDKFTVENDSTLESRFKNFALNLFLKGTDVEDSLLLRNTVFIGICLQHDTIYTKSKSVFLNMCALKYNDSRETDFHKRIYFPGFEGMAYYYLICKDSSEMDILSEALDSYLKHNTIPYRNEAYKFMMKYYPEDDSYGRIVNSDGESKVIIQPGAYSYLRRNGNYLIHIQGEPDVSLNTDPKRLYVTDYFVKNWYTISVLLLNNDSGRPFDSKFH